VYVHVIRVDAMDEGKPQIWRIVSDEKGTVLLDKEMLTCVPFAAGSPYRIPHRLYGRSLADLLIEVQKIRTALTRLHLDSGFFSIN
ncbi:portal protein, partial [Streptococcus pneumoniae]|uniref:portal protein n=1 Tax=Streptococcus pneumoniae TaxID=1313 RepID=UPI001E4BD033